MAEIVTVCWELTVRVDTVNVPEDCPAAIVTVEGTAAEALLLWRAMAVPPASAGVERVTVAKAVLPPTTVAGATVNACKDAFGWLTVRLAENVASK